MNTTERIKAVVDKALDHGETVAVTDKAILVKRNSTLAQDKSYVTWEYNVTYDEYDHIQVSLFWGHYDMTFSKALEDFNKRAF